MALRCSLPRVFWRSTYHCCCFLVRLLAWERASWHFVFKPILLTVNLVSGDSCKLHIVILWMKKKTSDVHFKRYQKNFFSPQILEKISWGFYRILKVKLCHRNSGFFLGHRCNWNRHYNTAYKQPVGSSKRSPEAQRTKSNFPQKSSAQKFIAFIELINRIHQCFLNATRLVSVKSPFTTKTASAVHEW